MNPEARQNVGVILIPSGVPALNGFGAVVFLSLRHKQVAGFGLNYGTPGH